MRLVELLREAVAASRAQRVPTALVALLAGAMCLTTILTVGRTAAAETAVATRLDEAGSRHLVVRDARDAGFLTASMIKAVSSIATVERAVGLGGAFDVTNLAVGVGGTRVPARQIVGQVADAVTLVRGRWPGPGEALVGDEAMQGLNMDVPVGAVLDTDGATYAVVGSFVARAPFEDLDNQVVIAAPPGLAARSLDVLVRDSAVARATEAAVLTALARPDPQDLEVQSPLDLASAQQDIAGQLGTFGRGMLALVMGAGAVLVAVVVLSDVLLHRRDLGRRRALGAPRWVIVGLVVLRTSLAGTLGAVLGTAFALVIANRVGGTPPATFSIAVAVIAILVAALAAVAPAVAASRADPVRVLRTP